LSEDVVIYEVHGGIARITLNRPPARNALNMTTLERVAVFLEHAERDGEVGAVVLTGAGDQAFSAGADIAYLHNASALEVRRFARLAVAVTHSIETLGKPVVAAINGDAFGGGLELAEACALRVAVPTARRGHPQGRRRCAWGSSTT
jgi:enoyl-CoA hydratase